MCAGASQGHVARGLKDKDVPVPKITKKLTIKTGKNADTNPLVASLYRALTEAEQAEAAGQARVGEQLRPVPSHRPLTSPNTSPTRP
ncbi:hypothetical protein OG298_37380 [Streptomyces sp. NBC_01005]|uniref:hypothetical protein n=1 Tax=unclassified Streptomyces TaxID=2593676 RepID=UPI0038675E2F|nr:hypothetical protein OG298_37380 [Streptomyces sp. NBC_01005]WTC99100.1 hypothetical protein OH736_37370 [Streptomyces sp. NBC_01650]